MDRHPSNGKRTQDIDHDLFYIEHKTTRSLPKYLKDMMRQLAECPDDKIPLGILAPLNTSKQYVLIDLDIFIQMLDEPSAGEG